VIAQVPAERITRISGINDQPIAADNLDRLLDQASLGIHGMDIESLGHEPIVASTADHPGLRWLAYHVR